MTRPRLILYFLGSLVSTLVGLGCPKWGNWLLTRLWGWYRGKRNPPRRARRRQRSTVSPRYTMELASLLANQGMKPNQARRLARQVYDTNPASFDEAVRTALQLSQKGS